MCFKSPADGQTDNAVSENCNFIVWIPYNKLVQSIDQIQIAKYELYLFLYFQMTFEKNNSNI